MKNASQYLDEQVVLNQQITVQAAVFHDRRALLQCHAKSRQNMLAILKQLN